MSFVDDEFALRFFMYQRNYKQVSFSPLKINCSCMICGDSSTDSFKARMWYYDHKGTRFVHCFNCDYSAGFSWFLKEQDPQLYEEYLLEAFKDSASPRKERVSEEPSDKFKKGGMPTIQELKFCQRLDSLPEAHPIIKYVEGRKIPPKAYNRLWFTAKWQELVNTVKPGTFENPKQEYRLVIPIFNKEGKIESFQGRALGPSKMKYMTIKAHEDSTKVYGQDTVDESKPVLILEGPLDSLFLDNAIAITGGSISLDSVPYPNNRIWVLDNENRHKDTIARMQKLIDAGETVCFWDESGLTSKDINDMIVKEGATVEFIQDYILNNSFDGMMASVRMMSFAKV